MKNTKTKSIVALAIVLVLTVVFGIVGVTSGLGADSEDCLSSLSVLSSLFLTSIWLVESSDELDGSA